MEVQRTSTSLTQLHTDCVVIGIPEAESVEASVAELEPTLAAFVRDLMDAGDFKAKAGQLLTVHRPAGLTAKRLLLVGLGRSEKRSAWTEREWFTALGQSLHQLPITTAHLDLASLIPSQDRGSLERLGYALAYSSYHYETTKPRKEPKTHQLRTLTVMDDTAASEALARGLLIGQGANLTRELGNLPGNTCTPRYLAAQAEQLATQYPTLTVEILDEAEMAEIGMHCLLSVSRGSEEPARFIVLKHLQDPDVSAKPKVLVGKGVTFDTGGISLKPGAGMDEMKFDMCGAATVLGCMQVVSALAVPKNIIGVIGAVENMPSGRATKPGDVVTTLSGKTVEILNTDAEGRLVLCDALTYVERFDPDAVVDIATLTGACLVALGKHNSGLLSTDDELAETLLALGRDTGDPCWRLPIEEPYQKLLDSNFADIA
ncbi:MAG: leucyl aminopeptidase, partial [Gammaproteobacteria bacterium]|nr:leucyl aminopeptidase [Gammaproteobacteria bacterium]